MSNIKALRQRKVEQEKALRALLDQAHGENRDLNEAEAAKYDEGMKALEGTMKSIEREERVLDIERHTAPADDPNAAAAAAAGSRGTGKEGFTNLGEFLQAVAHASTPSGRIDPRLMRAAATGMGEAVPSDGGFAVQTDFQEQIITRIFAGGELLSRVRRQNVNGNGLRINAVDETSRVDGSRWGGVQAFWANEADTVTAKKPKFRRLELELEKLLAIYYATDELIEDAAALGGIAAGAFGEELQFKAEDAIYEGDGSGKPLGFLNGGSLISVPKETSQVAATIVAENILNMWKRMTTRSKANSVWFVNADVVSQLPQLNVKIKNVAGSENVGGIVTPIYQFPNAGGFQSGNGLPGGTGSGTILGRPVVEIEYASTLGTFGDIVLADLSQYLLIEKAGVQMASSMHVRFVNDEMCYRLTWRLDGEPIWNKPLTPFKGSNTTSPFVGLATRA